MYPYGRAREMARALVRTVHDDIVRMTVTGFRSSVEQLNNVEVRDEFRNPYNGRSMRIDGCYQVVIGNPRAKAAEVDVIGAKPGELLGLTSVLTEAEFHGAYPECLNGRQIRIVVIDTPGMQMNEEAGIWRGFGEGLGSRFRHRNVVKMSYPLFPKLGEYVPRTLAPGALAVMGVASEISAAQCRVDAYRPIQHYELLSDGEAYIVDGDDAAVEMLSAALESGRPQSIPLGGVGCREQPNGSSVEQAGVFPILG